MERRFTYTIEETDLPCTIHSFLRAQGFSRHILASMKPHRDAVLCNGVHKFFTHPLKKGDCLTVMVRDTESSVNIIPAPVPFEIVYEDEDLMVINKPAGVSIHPAINHPADTLANGIALLFQERGIPYVFRSINRLDRDTTGLLILANNVYAASLLEQALQKREIRRTYLAVAEGILPEEGTVDLPIGRVNDSLIERCVDRANGDRAVTHFRRLDIFPAEAHSCFPPAEGPDSLLSLAELHLETGRTHQIRVHMKAIGHPLVGDTLYNPRYSERRGNSASENAPVSQERRVGRGSLNRQALHAWKLDFVHPITKDPMHFEAPVPEDMRALLPSASGPLI